LQAVPGGEELALQVPFLGPLTSLARSVTVTTLLEPGRIGPTLAHWMRPLVVLTEVGVGDAET
jgi:hypothetical protein